MICAAVLACGIADAFACSRVVYLGDEDITLVGRTLDWRTPIPTNIYVYPRGMDKESMPDGNRLRWTSRYGSVLAVGYDGGVTEGMNEAGLCMNGLFCKNSVYPDSSAAGDSVPVMSNSVLVSYFLDNFATVDEAAKWLRSNRFVINGKTFDGGTVSLLHWAMTDRTGQTLVMEFTDGKLNIYRGRDNLTVLTNDPKLPDMQVINSYWTDVGGSHSLPGTVKSPDRFVRASYFINHVPKNYGYPQAFGALTSVMGTVSVPFGYTVEGEPNISSTQWTSVADITGGKYYMRFTGSTGFMWVDMKDVSLAPGSSVLKLDTSANPGITGCVNGMLVHTAGFTPMW